MSGHDTSRISPTAHYTAYVWVRNGLSVPELATASGRRLYHAVHAGNRVLDALGQANLESMLLARHLVIDHLLSRAIAEGRVGQVVEIAAGLSPRGLRFRRRFPGCTYVEGDLPDMVETKRSLLSSKLDARHRITELNALVDSGPVSLDALAETLDRNQGTAVILEGLVNYFDQDAIEGIFRRVHHFLGHFPHGLMLSDFYLRRDSLRNLGARSFGRALTWFARGKYHLPYEDDRELSQALARCGFRDARIHMAGDFAVQLEIPNPKRSAYVRVIEAKRQ